ncbi:hypothetical protein MXB_5058 [Myxobolus squamalis]|nr:hypothetical protein MXB_5058 [Myxobolus squamalis]
MDSKIASLICVGDTQGLVKAFSSISEHAVAYAMAESHSFSQSAEDIKSNFLPDAQFCVPNTNEVLAHCPIAPQNTLSTFWPKLTASKSIFDIISDSRGTQGSGKLTSSIPEALFDNPNDIWNEDTVDDTNEVVNAHSDRDVQETPANDAWVNSEDEISIDVDMSSDFDHDSDTAISFESKPLYPTEWTLTDIPIFHIMTGNFSLAFKILHAKFGVINYIPLKSIFLSTYLHSKLLIPSFLLSQNLLGYPYSSSSNVVDMVPINLIQIHELAQIGFQLTTSGKFSEALSVFLNALHRCMVVWVEDKKKLVDLQSIFKSCKEYVVGLSIELERRSLENNPTRVAELAAYFTQCSLQPSHTVLVLRIAMNLFYKLKNYKTSGVMARRLLDLAPHADICSQARKVLAASEKYGLTNQVKVQYDEYNPFDICCGSFTPIYSGDRKITCSFCNSTFQPSFSNTVCSICQVGEVGVESPRFSIQKFSLA